MDETMDEQNELGMFALPGGRTAFLNLRTNEVRLNDKTLGYLYYKDNRVDWYVDSKDGDWPARFLHQRDAIEDLVLMHG